MKYLILLLFITSCSQLAMIELPKPTVSVPVTLPEKTELKNGWQPSYNGMIEKEVLASELVTLTSAQMNFCPRWDKLTKEKRAHEVANLFHGIAFYESGFELNNRYVESTMGPDPFTHKQVASEGLFQLSYQDSQNYIGCKGIDWSKDKSLQEKDLNKTIFNPEVQIKCSVFIANRLLTRRSEPVMCGKHCGLTRYWSTATSKQDEIKAKMKSYGSECFL